MVPVGSNKPLQPNGELYIDRRDDILNFEFFKLNVWAHNLLDNPRVLSRSLVALLFSFRPGDNNFAAAEDECSCLRVTNSHHYRSKSLGVVLSITRMLGDPLQVELDANIACRDDIPSGVHVRQQLLGEVQQTPGWRLGWKHTAERGIMKPLLQRVLRQ